MLTLHRLSSGYRVLYSAVLVFMTAGTLIHGVHQHARAGLMPAQVAAWYLGNEDDPAATVLLFPRTFEEVWGDVWMALTSYTLALLIFGSILMRSTAAPRLRAFLLVGYAAAALGAAAAPLLVRYGSAAFAWMDTVAILLLGLFAVAMTGVALHEMWERRLHGPRFNPARRR